MKKNMESMIVVDVKITWDFSRAFDGISIAGPVYKRVKKLPRFIPPWPFGVLVRDAIRPFPDNSVLIISPILIIGFFINYVLERLHG